MNREDLDNWCERGILALVLAIMVFGPLATGAVRTQDFLVIQGLTFGVLVLWGVRIWASARAQLLWPPICWAVLAFTLYAIGRYLKADIEYVARLELIWVLVYAFLFFAIINNLHRQESMQILSFTMVFLAMVISFYAIFQFLTDSNRVWHFVSPYKHRGSGTYICPNHLAGFLEMLLPLALGYTLISRVKPVAKVLLGYAALVMVAGIAVSVSRGSWVATALALAFFFGVLLNHSTHRLPSLVLLVVLVIGAIVVIPRSEHFQVRFKQLVNNGKVDDDMRFALWMPAVKLWQENFWWGVGPAHFDYRFPEYRPEEVQLRPDRAHNDILNTLVDYGLVGALLVGSAWTLLGIGVAKTWSFVRGSSGDLGGKKSSKFAFVLGASAGLLALLLHSTIDFNFHIPANAILAIALMALLSAHLRFATERYWVTMRAALKLLVSMVIAAGLFYLGRQGWQRYSEYVWLTKAAQTARTSLFSEKEAGFLEKAFAVEPKNFETAFNIAEAYRLRSQEGDSDYRQWAAKAMEWYERSMKLNPWKSYSCLNYGACLDWIGKSSEAAKYFSRAEELDPNGYFTVANVGLHYLQMGDYAAAKPWFERSLRLKWQTNSIASSYLQIVNEKMLEAATNEFRLKLDAVSP